MKKTGEYVKSKLRDPQNLALAAQVGVDITINKLFRIPITNTITPNSKLVSATTAEELLPKETVYFDIATKEPKTMTGWFLFPGAYAVEFDQGLAEPLAPDENGFIIQRSSLNRAGCRVAGSIFDPGFITPALGATIYVTEAIKIAQHARIAQFVIEINKAVPKDNLYNGTWQGVANYVDEPGSDVKE